MWLRYKLSLKKVFTYIKMIMFIKITFITQHGVHYINLRHSVFHHELHDWRVLAGQDGVPRFPDPFSWLPLEAIYATIRFIPMAHTTTIIHWYSLWPGADPEILKGWGILGLQAPQRGGGEMRGSNFMPSVKKPTTWAKKVGVMNPPPLDPPMMSLRWFVALSPLKNLWKGE